MYRRPTLCFSWTFFQVLLSFYKDNIVAHRPTARRLEYQQSLLDFRPQGNTQISQIGLSTMTYTYNMWEKNPHKMSSQEKTPQEKTSQKSPVEKTPHPILGLVEKTPHPIFRLVEKTPQLYKKVSFWNFHIFYLNCIQILTPKLYKKSSYSNFDIFI